LPSRVIQSKYIQIPGILLWLWNAIAPIKIRVSAVEGRELRIAPDSDLNMMTG
jgi:hypothetical protein